jgi:predicted permease
MTRHLRYAIRLLARSPLFTLCAVLSLAIGIGANTAIFTVANALLLAPTRAVVRMDRLVDIGRTTDGEGFDTVSYLTYDDLRADNPVFENLFAIRLEPGALSVGGEQGAEVAYGEQVSASYFDVLGLTPSAGTFFRTAEENLSAPLRKVVLSHAYWQRRFAAHPSAIGQSIVLNGTPFMIVGVGPAEFHGTTVLSPDLWLPVTAYVRGLPDETALRGRQNQSYTMTARLKPGVSIPQAQAYATAFIARLAAQYPEAYARRGLVVAPASRLPGIAGDFVTPFLAALMGVVGLVLLVACTNLAGLMLARAASRAREVAVRLALGASRSSLAGLLVTESLLLFGAGAMAGLGVARLLVGLMTGVLGAVPVPITLDLAVDWRVAAFTAGLALVTGTLTGLAPALQSTRANLITDLKGDSSAPRTQRLRHAFVTIQMAFSLVLIVLAGLFLRALDKATAIDPGFDVTAIDVATLDLGHAGYPEARMAAVAEEIGARLAALPGVAAVGSAAMIPLEGSGLGLGGLRPLGAADASAAIDTDWNIISPGYLQAIGVPIVRGRNFTAADRAGASRVAIVNEHLANAAWPGQDPVGRVLENGDFRPGRESTIERITVVGVAKNVKYRWLGEAPRPFIYVAANQHSQRRAHFFIRRGHPAAGPTPGVRQVLKGYDANLPLVRMQSLESYASLGLLPQRVAGSIAGSLGGVALLLAAIGLYGVTAFAVASRSREIGIRMALGANPRSVVRLMLGLGLRLVAIGGAIGLAVAIGAAQLVAGLLFGVSPLDPAAYVVTAGVLAGVAVVATYVPARRAAAVDPLIALRAE